MDLIEKDLEDMIWEAASDHQGREFLLDRGLAIDGTLFRQVNLGNYGVADLISAQLILSESVEDSPPRRQWHFNVYELKRARIGIDALGQALRYKDGLKRFLSESESRLPVDFNYKIHLIGSEIDQSHDFLSILKPLPFVLLYQYRFDYSGLHFLQSRGTDYSRTDPGKPNAKQFSRNALKAILQGDLAYDYRTE